MRGGKAAYLFDCIFPRGEENPKPISRNGLSDMEMRQLPETR